MNNKNELKTILTILFLVLISITVIYFNHPTSKHTSFSQKTIQNIVFQKEKSLKNVNVDSIPMVNDYAITNYAKRNIEENPNEESNTILKMQREEIRYKTYLLDCIIAEFGDSYKTSHVKSRLIFKLNKFGKVEAYSVYGVSDVDTRSYYDNNSQKIKEEFKTKLEKAFLKASPFQGFPKSITDNYIIVELSIGCGKYNEIIYDKRNTEPNWQHFINQNNKPANSKRYENSKITNWNIFLNSWSNDGTNIQGWELYPSDINLKWEPVKTANNHVIVRATISKDGTITEPCFIKKSNLKKANEAAITALLKTHVSQKSLDRLKTGDKTTLELHFTVR